jgi:hypothetical protein
MKGTTAVAKSRKRDRTEEQSEYYILVGKERLFNKYFRTKFENDCLQAFKKGPKQWNVNHLQGTLIPEALLAYDNVYMKMNELHKMFSELSSFQFDQLPALKQFQSGASWATFTPAWDADMESEYDKNRDLCESECKTLTQEKRAKYFKGPVFFIYLQKNQIQTLINRCSWLKTVCRILSKKCLIQVAVMSDFVDKVSSPRQKYVHRDLALSSSLSANFIVFLDDDITGHDGAVLSSHTNCTQRDISVSYMRSSVLYVSGKLYHSSSTSRAHGIHHAERKPSKGSEGYVHTQRRFLLINCCPYSKLNMLDQLLNCESYTEYSPYSLSQSVFIYENNTVSELSASEVSSCDETLRMVKTQYKK